MKCFLLKPLPRMCGGEYSLGLRCWSEAHVRATVTTVSSLPNHAFVAPSHLIRLHQVSLLQRNLSLHASISGRATTRCLPNYKKWDIRLQRATTSSTIDAGRYQRRQPTHYLRDGAVQTRSVMNEWPCNRSTSLLSCITGRFHGNSENSQPATLCLDFR